jgi:hypothetical protein
MKLERLPKRLAWSWQRKHSAWLLALKPPKGGPLEVPTANE